MKIITSISKSDSGRVGQCGDGEVVALCSRLSSEDLETAAKHGFSSCNIFKVRD